MNEILSQSFKVNVLSVYSMTFMQGNEAFSLGTPYTPGPLVFYV